MSALRVGIGVDAHAFAEDAVLVVGGVEFPGEPGLAGHSDGDVVAHALVDALLGAAGLGDIGRWFPDTDEKFRGADSRELLREVVARVAEAGWQPVNVDLTLTAEVPRVAPHVERMRERLAKDLGLAPAAVNVKATTTEGLGFTGRKEGIAAQAIALVRHK